MASLKIGPKGAFMNDVTQLGVSKYICDVRHKHVGKTLVKHDRENRKKETAILGQINVTTLVNGP